MDFRIERARPDGIKVEVEFWVETWDDLAILMNRLQQIDAEDQVDVAELMKQAAGIEAV